MKSSDTIINLPNYCDHTWKLLAEEEEFAGDSKIETFFSAEARTFLKKVYIQQCEKCKLILKVG